MRRPQIAGQRGTAAFAWDGMEHISAACFRYWLVLLSWATEGWDRVVGAGRGIMDCCAPLAKERNRDLDSTLSAGSIFRFRVQVACN